MGGLFKLSSSSHLFASVWGGQEESKEGESGLESFPFWYKRRPEGKRGGRGIFFQSGPAKLILPNVEQKYE